MKKPKTINPRSLTKDWLRKRLLQERVFLFLCRSNAEVDGERDMVTMSFLHDLIHLAVGLIAWQETGERETSKYKAAVDRIYAEHDAAKEPWLNTIFRHTL